MNVRSVSGLMLVKYKEFDEYFPCSPKFSGEFDSETLERELVAHAKDLKNSVDILFKGKKVEWLEITMNIDYEDTSEPFRYRLECREPDHGKVAAAIGDYCRAVIREARKLKLSKEEYLKFKPEKTVQQKLMKWFS